MEFVEGNDMGRVIELDDADPQGLGLIVAATSGQTYSNQCGGYACRHPELEGVYVALGPTPASFENHFVGESSKWKGHCYDGIDEETARFLDVELASDALGRIGCVTVDHGRLRDSEEAWVWVKIAENHHPLLRGHGGRNGVLVWENSD